MNRPVQFVFGVHVHQPVGNFDHVFEEHVQRVYRPFLRALVERDIGPVALHVSGPLLEWLSTNERPLIDMIGTMASDRKVELLLSGFYEPILAAIPRADRVEQVQWMRDALRSTFGVEATGLWLTERVWEPSLAKDLADANVEYLFVDDHHFLVSGFERHELHAPFRAESDGSTVAVLPIDERLRYLVPFRPPQETLDYFFNLQSHGHALAVLADDGEKFGGWPGTYEWVYERGWLDEFLTALTRGVHEGVLELRRPVEAVRSIPSAGLAYLPTASYREMEQWALPPAAGGRLRELEDELTHDRMRGPEGALVRGSHWHHFFVKYPEINRLHKKMARLSALTRERGNPSEAREAIGRSQCNDAYWHGVFGGSYLPHLRNSAWYWLARAEGSLRRGEGLEVETADLDLDGHDEIWIHSRAFSAVIAPTRGGALEEFTTFSDNVNRADVLTRRLEAYHLVPAGDAAATAEGGGTPSIHDLERMAALDDQPPFDAAQRGIFVEYVIGSDVAVDRFNAGGHFAVHHSRGLGGVAKIAQEADAVTITIAFPDDSWLVSKTYHINVTGNGTLTVRWHPDRMPEDARFATELSLAKELELSVSHAERWDYPIKTLMRWEGGLEETTQGNAVVLCWPGTDGRADIEWQAPGHS